MNKQNPFAGASAHFVPDQPQVQKMHDLTNQELVNRWVAAQHGNYSEEVEQSCVAEMARRLLA